MKTLILLLTVLLPACGRHPRDVACYSGGTLVWKGYGVTVRWDGDVLYANEHTQIRADCFVDDAEPAAK